METYYTYAYLREDGTPYYIGKGKGRRAFHKNHSVQRPPKDRILFLKTNLSEENALKHERYLISILDNLLNVKNYGYKGRSSLSEEHKEKISKKLKIIRHLQIITDEHKKNTSISVKSYWDNLSEEDKTKRCINLRKKIQKKFIVDGIEYDGIDEIAKKYNIDKQKAYNRIYQKNWKDWYKL